MHLAMTGCITVGPDYKKPEIASPADWENGQEIRDKPDYWAHRFSRDQWAIETASEKWWQRFGDPTLTELIESVRKNHPDMTTAEARVREAWAQRGVLAAAWLPHSDGRAESNFSENFADSFGKPAGGFTNRQLASIDAGWETDLFGGIRRQVEATTAEWQSAIEWRRDALVTLSAEVALQYIAVRTLERRLFFAKQGTAAFHDMHATLAQREKEGITPKTDVTDSLAQYAKRASQVPRIEQDLEVAKIRLATTSGVYPSALRDLIAEARAIPVPPDKVTVGVPADVLRLRPDVRRAERKLAAHTALIGVAVADLYPNLSVSGALSFESRSVSSLFDQVNRAYGFGPKLKWKIFHGCAPHYRIKEQQAQTEQRLAEYEKTVLNAVAEVEIALTRISTEKHYEELQTKAANAQARNFVLMKDAYMNGIVDLRRLLTTMIDYYDALDEASAAQGRRAIFAVQLFKAIGGGQLPDDEAFAPND